LQAKPGSDIDISVTTEENSFVGLLGVDQSVMLLKKGNDIEPSMVFTELEKYGSTEKFNYSYYQQRDDVDFRDANAIIITNAKVPFCEC
jgi:CD109 antigen